MHHVCQSTNVNANSISVSSCAHHEQSALNDRKCILCQANFIESEECVILKCDTYTDIRDDITAYQDNISST